MSKYKGKYKTFNRSLINTYPLKDRPNKVNLKDLISLEQCRKKNYNLKNIEDIRKVARWVVSNRREKKPIFWMMGAHPVKNGLSPIIIDWLERNIISVLSMNPAATIHDFELALIGETSEDVPNALSEGKFGFAFETGRYINDALIWGASKSIGYGEAIALMISGEKINHKGLDKAYSVKCPNAEKSIVYNAYKKNIPITVHATIGTDIIDQHQNFRGEAKGKTSGIDFEIFIYEVTKLISGGLFLNIGAAITGPEVFLKAISMVANAGYKLKNINTADFDIRSVHKRFPPDTEESYYFRDFKSVITRIPNSFDGEGIYIQGNHLNTIPALYKAVEEEFNL